MGFSVCAFLDLIVKIHLRLKWPLSNLRLLSYILSASLIKYFVSCCVLCLVLIPRISWTYPNFISYGYKSCLTCHFNGQGNGALNDYGRALFATEIASRSFYDPKTSLEELGESSGFLGKTQLPWWYRPGVKIRGLWFQTDPGSTGQRNRFIPMQADINSAFIFDEDQKYISVVSFGYMPTPSALQNSSGNLEKPSNWVSREHYFRWQATDKLFIYLGLMDKVFGIRTVDHTAFSRVKVGLAQNDQSHGTTVQYYQDKWEYTANAFIGNLAQKSELRQKGFSGMIERDLSEKFRVGGALLYSNNDYINWTRLEAHSKLGFGLGHSLMAEVGLVEDKPKNSELSRGAYVFSEAQALLAKGYNFFSQLEFYNQTLTAKSPDQLRWTVGALMFPAPKFEFRAYVVNQRIQSDSGITPDQWQIQLQTHLSL